MAETQREVTDAESVDVGKSTTLPAPLILPVFPVISEASMRGALREAWLQFAAQAGGRLPTPPLELGEVVEVVAHAMEVLGDRNKAVRWLRTPIPSLNDQTPEEVLGQEGGVEKVQQVLGRIEHGVW